ncbi:ShlB/FhaC/HecB family hemolysin secretion/activation protein [Polaribacter dokdonensis]|uniref:Hemolysin activation/secretion protein n=1 Tax=Polaribacter dokdonensis DSW-5 TaxID=1300348 RepID=A0A0M9CEB9_9FLAO|nr:POTRA domain-containing protein [Polaribacter dokdonensis]KOY50911.1 Outer membrane protein [Polaribacter dokdonensis DSW-5]SEE23041.1 Hemolysin activation/secretion protein [Polaribacter dokdonensis DSW-5]
MNSNTKLAFLITIVFILYNITEINSQDFELKLLSKVKKENIVLSEINYPNKHKDSTSIENEITRVTNQLKKRGYFLNTVDSIIYTNRKVKAYFSLKEKITSIILEIKPSYLVYFNKNKLKNNKIKIPIENLDKLLSSITSKLDKQGKSFSSVEINNIILNKDELFGLLVIKESKKRTIDKITIRGYEQFSQVYLKMYLRIKKGDIFNEDLIKRTSNLTKRLSFIDQIKEPEILFTKDSTILYIYLRKNQNNSLDALVNFATEENGDFLLNGNIDLELNNILNSGEQFKLFWNRIGQERQEFKLSTSIPYIFKSNITPQIAFSLYRQDSSFTNINFKTSLSYNLNDKNSVSAFYSIENSENLESITNDIKEYDNYFIGLNYDYNNLKEKTIYNELSFSISTGIGSRKSDNQSFQQYNFKSSLSFLIKFNQRNQFYIRNKTGLLESKNYLTNELLRIGGANSIRGFNEQSIFAKQFSFFNFEYRFITNQNSYLYTITDIGGYKQENNYKSLIGLGFGYLFGNDKYTINLALATGKFDSSKLELQNTKFLISWINYF